jgi:RNA polymerase sigma factor (sigma-70 family)
VPDAPDDRSLVQACLQGEASAWEALIEKYQNLIYSIPIKYGASPDAAADIFQAVCVDLFDELPRLRSIDNVRPWLVTVAAHKSYHWKRKHVRQAQHEVEGIEEDALPSLLVHPALNDEVAREQSVREALRRLSERCRELIQMLFYDEPSVPYAQCAERLGLATGSIGFIRGRCLQQLQGRLEELGF